MTFFASVSVLIATDVSESQPKGKVKILDVGGGNCQILRVEYPGKPCQYLVYDAGSRAFRESSLNQKIEALNPPVFRTPEKSSDETTTHSYPSQHTPNVELAKKMGYTPIGPQDILQKIWDYIAVGNKEKIVKTVVISHPDLDHVSFLMRLFDLNSGFKIQNLILSGPPEEYFSANWDRFSSWVQQMMNLDTKMKLYCPTIQKGPISSFSEVCEDQEKGLLASFYGGPNQDWTLIFGDAFNFGEAFLVRPWAINTSHHEVDRKTKDSKVYKQIFCSSESKNTNVYSLVLEIKYKTGQSILFTGDATDVTMRRIFWAFGGEPSELGITYLIASHHGSCQNETNSLEWMKKLNPKVVFISCGHHGRNLLPHAKTLEIFKNCGSLWKVHPHPVFRGPDFEKRKTLEEGDRRLRGEVKHTTDAVFSTYSSGDIEVNLGGPIKIKCSKQSEEKEFVARQPQQIQKRKRKNSEDKSQTSKRLKRENEAGILEAPKKAGNRASQNLHIIPFNLNSK